MSAEEIVTIGFCDPAGTVQGLAIAGAGALLAYGPRVVGAPPFALHDIDGASCRVEGAGAYDLVLEPLGPPADLGPAARTWICAARGSVGDRRLDGGLGSITRTERSDRVALERAVTAWMGPGLAVALAARRGRRAGGHGEEDLHAALLRGEPLEAEPVADPRLSSTYDGDGRVIRCGVELWESPDSEFARRFGGRATAHGELTHADGARTRVAFMLWRGDRERGIGRYEITER